MTEEWLPTAMSLLRTHIVELKSAVLEVMSASRSWKGLKGSLVRSKSYQPLFCKCGTKPNTISKWVIKSNSGVI